MQIKFLKKVDKPGIKTRAFFSVEWEGRLVIHDCRLVEGKDGKLFIAFPFRVYEKDGQKKYQPLVQVEQELLVEISKLANHEYESAK